MESLIEAGFDVNAKNSIDQTPLMYAADNGEFQTESDCYKFMIILFSCLGNSEIAEYLIDGNANVNARNTEAQTPLMYAIHKGITVCN